MKVICPNDESHKRFACTVVVAEHRTCDCNGELDDHIGLVEVIDYHTSCPDSWECEECGETPMVIEEQGCICSVFVL